MASIIPVASFDCIVFGATGDLTTRKLLPALCYRFKDGQIPGTPRIIGASRSEMSVEAFRERAREAIESARALIREALEKNRDAVQRVAEGSEPDAWLKSRFGYPTG